ncbi:MAG TPA: hypothetical protein VMS09_00900 [Paenibacillus sp.]|uniref:hypothetical protein n=1 Tax=Paenibacillus sp. TaxID=58172 RepID=UPI0028D8B781|nr:hypothetical protein [Paenibacillus sp.]HUC90565.1 hypothetical protein [Paenibacillus sp.]
MKKWIGIAAHAALGVVFPYVLGGTIVLLYGLMTPSVVEDKVIGALIAGTYLALLAAVNWAILRGETRRGIGAGLLRHAAAWLAAAAVMFYLVRQSIVWPL